MKRTLSLLVATCLLLGLAGPAALAAEPTAEDGAAAFISGMSTQTGVGFDAMVPLSAEERAAGLETIGLAPETVLEAAWYRTEPDRPDGLYLEVLSLRMTEDVSDTTAARTLSQYGLDLSREAHDAYLAAQGQEGRQLGYWTMAHDGYAVLGIFSFDKDGLPLGRSRDRTFPTQCIHDYTDACLGGMVVTQKSETTFILNYPGVNLSGGFITYDGQLASAPTPTPPVDPATGRMLFRDPEKVDMTVYDTSAILDAWQKKDPAGLDDHDRAIYDAAEKVLTQVLTDGMTDLEKERAIYDWVTWNIDYDWTQTDPLAETSPDAGTPYGGLVSGDAICLGVAATFELLMDMAGIECITVVGASYHSEEDHAWTMARLDGAWYCQDPTWDLYSAWEFVEDKPTREQWGPGCWRFFNVTSDYMAENDHQWDYASVPET